MECINQSITHGVLFIAYILNTSGLTFFMLIKNTPFRNIFLGKRQILRLPLNLTPLL